MLTTKEDRLCLLLADALEGWAEANGYVPPIVARERELDMRLNRTRIAFVEMGCEAKRKGA